jgi:hypothetical protein
MVVVRLPAHWQSMFGGLAVSRSRGYADVTGAERLRHDAAMDRTPGFMRQVQEFLELNFMISEYFLRIFQRLGPGV